MSNMKEALNQIRKDLPSELDNQLNQKQEVKQNDTTNNKLARRRIKAIYK